jgi:tetratricopeptide (TPR) repeat protein
MSAIRCFRRAITVAFAVLIVATHAHAQQAEDHFKKAMDARKLKQWQEAAAALRLAITADPKEDRRKVGGVNALVGTIGGTEYLPHYFLGEALYNVNDCPGAIEAWAESEKQAVVRDADLVGVRRRGIAACEAKGVLSPAKYDPQHARVTQQIAEVRNVAESVSATGKAHHDIWTAQAGLREQYDRATGDLQQAQSRLTSAERSRLERDFVDASAAAERARNVLKTIESQLRTAIDTTSNVQALAKEVDQILRDADAADRVIEGKRAALTPSLASLWQGARDTVAKARSQAGVAAGRSNIPGIIEARALAQDALTKFGQIQSELTRIGRTALAEQVAAAALITQDSVASVERSFAAVAARFGQRPGAILPGMIEQRDTLLKQVEGERRRFEVARQRQDVSTIQDVSGILGDVNRQLTAIVQQLQPPLTEVLRPELIEGARLFFAGEYQKALDWLDPAKLADTRLEQLHGHLFRAAAAYTLYIRSGSRDTSRRTLAIDEINRCKQIDPGFAPEPRAFGPRFVAFFQNVGPHGTQVQSGATPLR